MIAIAITYWDVGVMLFFLNLQHFPASTFLDENLKYPRHHPHTCFLWFSMFIWRKSLQDVSNMADSYAMF